MKPLPEIESPEWEALWGRFAAALLTADLRDSEGNHQPCDVADFMLMQIDNDGVIGFKNIATRNYVYLKTDGTLDVPVTDQMFHRGFFIHELDLSSESMARLDKLEVSLKRLPEEQS